MELDNNNNQQDFSNTPEKDNQSLPSTSELLRSNEDLLREVHKLESELSKVQKELSTRKEEEANTNVKLLRQRDLLARAGHQIQEHNENMKKKNQDITLLKEEVASLNHQLKCSESEKTAALEKLTQEEQKSKSLNSEIEKFKTEVDSMINARVLEEVNKAVLSLQKSNREKQCEYEEKIANLEKSNSTLEKEFASYRIRAQSLVQATETLSSDKKVQTPEITEFVMESLPVVHTEERTTDNTGEIKTPGTMVSFLVVHTEERTTDDTSLPVVHTEERTTNDTGEVVLDVHEEVSPTEELECTHGSEPVGLFQEARDKPSFEEGVLQKKVTALEAQIVQLQRELQDRVSQEETRRIRRLLEKKAALTETHQKEIKQLLEKYEEEKRKLAEYKEYATSLLHEKQNDISNLKDTIEVLEQYISGKKIPPTTPLEVKENSQNPQIQLLKKELEESKKMSELLFLQQDVLKEEIRRLERTQKRDGNFNSEYLKNVLLKYMQTGHQEGLVRVIAEMLQFSPEELASVTKGQSGAVKVGGFWQGLF